MARAIAIAGGIVALSARQRGIPTAWIEVREPFPEDFLSWLILQLVSFWCDMYQKILAKMGLNFILDLGY